MVHASRLKTLMTKVVATSATTGGGSAGRVQVCVHVIGRKGTGQICAEMSGRVVRTGCAEFFEFLCWGCRPCRTPRGRDFKGCPLGWEEAGRSACKCACVAAQLVAVGLWHSAADIHWHLRAGCRSAGGVVGRLAIAVRTDFADMFDGEKAEWAAVCGAQWCVLLVGFVGSLRWSGQKWPSASVFVSWRVP